jgi:hypothetical protein
VDNTQNYFILREEGMARKYYGNSGCCDYVVYQYSLPAAVERFLAPTCN